MLHSDNDKEVPPLSPPRAKEHLHNFRSFLGKRKHDKDILGCSQRTPGSDEVLDNSLAGPTTEGNMSLVNGLSKDEVELDADIHARIFPPGTDIHERQTATDLEQDLLWTDGSTEHGRRRKPAVAAIFIHAGAGYHSTANEGLHLSACCDAARAAMKLLKTGGLAVEGVEAAIKILEDKEITNAGFGSNLAIDGNVECDATLVDHLGRSGACGAVPNIKNPISLAKSVLEKSNIPLTLRRVPPNLLVGKGAKDFAWENGMPLVPNDWLVSKNAKDRFVRWKEDLDRASARGPPTPNAAQRLPIPEYRDETRQKTQRDHHNAILMGTWNEGQPDSPANPATPLENAGSPGTTGSSTKSNSPLPNSSSSPRPTLRDSTGRSPLSFLGSLTSPRTAPNIGSSRTGSPVSKKPRFHASEDGIPRNSDDGKPDEIETSDRASSLISTPTPMATTYLTMLASQIDSSYIDSSSTDVAHSDDEDRITDTVGAIAIDQWGNMAAGSSSGGIGMKHRGRVGPAALVGVGTAIIPADPHDDDQVVVGAVTSGTGEHMATTMASQKCAERLYHGTRRGEGGLDITEAEESVVMESFIVKDFQNHPGVLNSSSASAIGAMAIKQTRNGYYLYFAHNTDSFALASMCSGDRQPHCVMSRLKEGSTGVAQGARKIRTE